MKRSGSVQNRGSRLDTYGTGLTKLQNLKGNYKRYTRDMYI